MANTSISVLFISVSRNVYQWEKLFPGNDQEENSIAVYIQTYISNHVN